MENLLGFFLSLKVPLGALSLSASSQVGHFLVLGTMTDSIGSHG
jgi:hypothetical protein